jgi:hypothetical protein
MNHYYEMKLDNRDCLVSTHHFIPFIGDPPFLKEQICREKQYTIPIAIHTRDHFFKEKRKPIK